MAKNGFKSSNQDHRYNQTFNENYGRALYLSGKKDDALPLLRAAAKKSKSFWLLKMLGMMAFEESDTLNATSYFERAVRVQSPDVTKDELVYIYTLLGRLFLNKSERDGALRNYTKVIELDPTNKEAKDYISKIQKTYEQDKMMKTMENIGEL
jgi:tetratricopeptide (TPR) repeat protein